MKIKIFRNKYIKSFLLLLLVGFLLSFIYYGSLSKNEINNIISSLRINKIYLVSLNNIIDHLKILSLILLFSFIFIGFPIYIGLIVSEGFSFCLRSIFLYKLFKVNGVIYSFLYYIVNNGIYLFLLYYLFKKIIKIIKIIYKYKFKQETIKFDELFRLLFNGIIIIVFILISDALLFFYGTKILKVFAFLVN